MRTHSVTVSFRLPKALADALRVRAAEGFTSASDLARRALGRAVGFSAPVSPPRRTVTSDHDSNAQ